MALVHTFNLEISGAGHLHSLMQRGCNSMFIDKFLKFQNNGNLFKDE